MIGSASRLRARVRGVLGLGVIGGGVGFVAGGVWGVLSSMVRAGVVFELDYFRFLLRMGIGNATGFMLIGAFTAAGFGVLLSVIDRRHTLEELPLWRMGLLGALMGASFPPIYVIWQSGFSTYWATASQFLPAVAGLAAVGGVLTSSMVAMARRAGGDQLRAGDDTPPRRLETD